MPNARKPDNIHKLKGTYQPCRHGDPDNKPDWSEGFPPMPACIANNKGAKKEWNRLKKNVPSGVITITDMSSFAQYCLLWSQMDEEGVDFGATKHSQLRLIEADLSFTPSSRGKIGGTPKKDSGSGSFGRT